jgi:hypothetical protein
VKTIQKTWLRSCWRSSSQAKAAEQTQSSPFTLAK